MRLVTLLAIVFALALPAVGAAHSHPPKLLHPNAADLRALAIRASDLVEARGLKYVGAVGVCKAEDRAVVKSGPGWKHVRCRMHTRNGYRFLVVWHATNQGTISVTVTRTL